MILPTGNVNVRSVLLAIHTAETVVGLILAVENVDQMLTVIDQENADVMNALKETHT